MASIHPAPAPRYRRCTPHNHPCDDLRGILLNLGEATNVDTAGNEELLAELIDRLAPLGTGLDPARAWQTQSPLQ